MRSTSSGFIKSLLSFLLVIWVPPSILPILKLSFLFDHLPSAYLFSVQLWDISEILHIFICYHSCFVIKFSLIPITSLSIQLQSANGSLSQTCGLAKNVLFTLEDVTVLLQAHIMETAPYKILLGRPFNAITESTIVNDQEENQLINITCPNTETRAAILTYKQGSLPRKPETLVHFHWASRNLRRCLDKRYPVS